MFSAILPAFYPMKVADVTVLFFINVKPDLYIHVLYIYSRPNTNQRTTSVGCLISGWSPRFCSLGF